MVRASTCVRRVDTSSDVSVGRRRLYAVGMTMSDQRPLARVFLEQRGRLLRYLAARGAGNGAEDLLQDLWVKVSSEQVVPIDPAAYLMRMAHNLMLDRIRASGRSSAREQVYHEAQPDAAAQPGALHQLIARERLTQVVQSLAALGERTDEIFRLYRLDGVAQGDIAARLGISLSAVEKHLQKAYRVLATLRRDQDAADPAIATGDVS